MDGWIDGAVKLGVGANVVFPGFGLMPSITATRHTEAWGLKPCQSPSRVVALQLRLCLGIRSKDSMTHKRICDPHTTLGL